MIKAADQFFYLNTSLNFVFNYTVIHGQLFPINRNYFICKPINFKYLFGRLSFGTVIKACELQQAEKKNPSY